MEPRGEATASQPISPFLCTHAATGSTMVVQVCFICKDCQDDTPGSETKCCCEACAEVCHAGHDVVHLGYGRCFCDCAACGQCSAAHTEAAIAAAASILGKGRTLSAAATGSAPPPIASSVCALTAAGLAGARTAQLRDECTRIASASKETFWLRPDAVPRNAMEALAMLTFHHHVAALPPGSFDASASGAEFWTQVKDPNARDAGVDLHYDKDEALAEAFGLGIFPHTSTVTYLELECEKTDAEGVSSCRSLAPTVVFSAKIGDQVGQDIESVVISHPAPAKQLAFDGRLLHGAPADVALRRRAAPEGGGAAAAAAAVGGEEEEGEEGNAKGGAGAASASALPQPLSRITFLVNVWLNHRPCGIAELSAKEVASTRCDPDDTPEAQLTRASNFATAVHLTPTVVETPLFTVEVAAPAPRIILPFVSRSATWGKEEGESGLVLSMPVPSYDSRSRGTVRVVFGGAGDRDDATLAAYLEPESGEDEDDDEDDDEVDYEYELEKEES